MIRHWALVCKLFSLKKSSLESYAQYAARPVGRCLACPVCGSKGNCVPHGSYKRVLIDVEHGKVSYGSVEIKRVRCKSCGHTHAILPDYIVPYATYSLLFILRVLAAHVLGSETVEQLCRRYGISPSMLYEWKALFLTHKKLWLGALKDTETDSARFIRQLMNLSGYSDDFGRPFYRETTFSFLQRHKDAAFFRHAVF